MQSLNVIKIDNEKESEFHTIYLESTLIGLGVIMRCGVATFHRVSAICNLL